VSALRAIALGVFGIVFVLNGHEAAAATVIPKSKSVFVRQTGNVGIGHATDEPKRLRPIEKYILRSCEPECETALANQFGSFTPGGQNALGKNVHDLSVIGETGQLRGYYYVVFYVSQKCGGFSVVFDSISGAYAQRSELTSGGISLMEFVDLASADSFATRGVVMVDDKQNRTLGLRENVGAVTSGFRRSFARLDRPLHMASLVTGNFPEPGSRAPKRESENPDHDGRQRSDSPIVFVSEIAGASVEQPKPRPLPYDRATENANTFVKGLILMGILAGMYTIGKGLGLIDQDASTENTDEPKQAPNEPAPMATKEWRWRRWRRCLRHRNDRPSS
jgi:hypothetical protein